MKNTETKLSPLNITRKELHNLIIDFSDGKELSDNEVEIIVHFSHKGMCEKYGHYS